MKILITGASGLIGSELVRELVLKKHKVVVLTRNITKAKKKLPYPIKFYLGEEGMPPPKALQGIQGVINLMGETIASKRWTKRQKKKIYDSRVQNTKNLVQALKEQKLDFFISASAIGYYPHHSTESLNEESAAGKGFLAKICKAWEKEALESRAKRVVIFRLGVVLSNKGGALTKLLPIFRMNLGGTIGLGKRQFNWIHLKDVIYFLCLAISEKKYKGIFNLLSPNPVNNKEFTKILAKTLHRTTFLPVVPILLKWFYGDMSSLLLDDQKISPQKLLQLRHPFLYPKIEDALSNIIGDF